MTVTTRTTEIRKCKTCGSDFTARVVTGVVNCQDCREARRNGTSASRKTWGTAGAINVDHVHTCTVVVGADGRRCGARAVFAFKSAISGEIFAECAEHHS